jgi:hypothetical protein
MTTNKARAALTLVILALLASACGSEPSGLSAGGPGEGSTPAALPEPSDAPSASPQSGPTTSLEVWLTKGETLYLVHRSVPETAAVGRAALEALLQGPTTEEAALEISSALPDDVELRDLSISDGVATVDLSGSYERGGGSLALRMRLAQVVFTLTQFPTVTGVSFRIDGEPITTFSGEGIDVSSPQRRKDYDDLLPPIVVESPAVGERVSSPVEISGTANVFEATVSIRILDADGNVLVETFTTATCGTGCRGTYEEAVPFSVDFEQQGRIIVYESSAEDGSVLFPVTIPVTLVP